MNLEKFEKLHENKKNRIIEAAMNEFIKEGFNGASTNTIVKNAEISKGALFNYFENKENLYLYLIKENLNKLLENFQDRKELPKSLEFFEGLELFINANINFFTAHPNTFKFLANAITSAPPHIRETVLKAKRDLQGSVIKYIISNSSKEIFRDALQIERIENIILILLDSLSNKYIEKYNGNIELLISSTEERKKEIIEYIDLIKYGILKREEKWKNG